jgi:hypothetical protein
MKGCRILVVSGVVSGIRAVAVSSCLVFCQSQEVAFSDSTVVQVLALN